jgi:hypothetical protein
VSGSAQNPDQFKKNLFLRLSKFEQQQAPPPLQQEQSPV